MVNWLARTGAILALGVPMLRGDTRGAALGDGSASRPSSREILPEESRYHLDTWKQEQGLPDDKVQAILQTHDGYLWIGTPSGLARFDGMRFTRFDHSNVPEMANDNCVGLSEDRDGSLWIATPRKLLRRKEHRFTAYSQKDGLGEGEIWNLSASPSGGLWLLSREGLTRYQDGAFSHVRVPAHLRVEAAGLGEGRNGLVWVGSDSKLERLELATGRWQGIDCRRFGGLRQIQADLQGTVWFAGVEDILCVAKDHWTPELIWQGGKAVGHITCMTLDRAGDLWLGTSKLGVYHYHDSHIHRVMAPGGLPDNAATALCPDREGDLWIGTERGGLSRLQPNTVSAVTTNEGLVNDDTWAICEGLDGALWIGTDGGLTELKGGRAIDLTDRDGLPRNTVRALLADREGNLWVGTGDGLCRSRDGKFTRVKLGQDLASNKIRVIYEDRSGSIWIGTTTGLNRIQNGLVTHFTTRDGLSNDDVRAILQDQAGDLWLGTFGGGLARFRAGKFTALTTNDGLSSDFVWALYEDAAQVLWAATERGLNRIKDGRITAYRAREGLFDDAVNYLLEDEFGYLWLSSEHGLYRVSKANLDAVAEGRARSVTAAHYVAADGMLSIETNGQKSQPAGCKDRQGRLWFPTTRGVVTVNPSKLGHQQPPPVVIEQVLADNRIIFGDGIADDVRRLASTSSLANRDSTWVLPPGHGRVLEFHYTANTFVASEQARFKYRLDGLDGDWTDAGTRRVAYFTSLRPGRYRFHVVACNSHGVWNETGATFAFYVAPHLYQTWEFYALGSVSVLLAGLGGHRLRIRVLQRIQGLEKQLAVERERARIARDIHDDLGAGLTQIGLLTTLAERDLQKEQPAATQVHKIKAVTQETLQSMDEIVWAINPQNDTLRSLLAYLRGYASDFVASAGVALRPSWPDNIPECTVPTEVRHHLFLVVKEALHNAVQHAHTAEITLDVKIEGSTLRVCIEDHGRGFDRKEVVGTGNGLANMERRVAALGGRLQIVSRPRQGTAIRVDLPLREVPRQ